MQNSRLRPEAVYTYRERAQTRIEKQKTKSMEKTAARRFSTFAAFYCMRITNRVKGFNGQIMYPFFVFRSVPSTVCASKSRLDRRRQVQNPRSRSEGVQLYVESERTGRGKRKIKTNGENRPRTRSVFHLKTQFAMREDCA